MKLSQLGWIGAVGVLMVIIALSSMIFGGEKKKEPSKASAAAVAKQMVVKEVKAPVDGCSEEITIPWLNNFWVVTEGKVTATKNLDPRQTVHDDVELWPKYGNDTRNLCFTSEAVVPVTVKVYTHPM